MNEVRLGIIGVGNMGSGHIGNIEAGRINNLKLTAICDIVPEKMERFDEKYKRFTDSAKMIRSGEVDAVLVATPHYFHTTIGIDALKNGIHTLVEKPVSVHKADAQKLIAAHKDPKVVFAAMFNQRTDPHYINLKKIIADGQLGEITRVNWIITDWFRTQAYYDGGGWRATWAGEGGGVLLNQCPHNLDLWQWLFGMPSSVRAYCKLGQYHDIEVEDAVTAYFEYPNGATGVFITTTGEAPGTNRLEVCGENGKIVVENGKITWTKNVVAQSEFLKTDPGSFNRPDVWTIDIPCNGGGQQHVGILQNFVDAILNGEELIAPASEGLNSVELANSMLYSSFTDKTVKLPLNASAYEKHLKQLIAKSKPVKKPKVKNAAPIDMSASFGKA
jgi:Predicted dehydrogenases and related proteins